MTHRYALGIRAALIVAAAGFATNAAAQSADALGARLDALEAQVVAAEDIAAIKRLQREYGYYGEDVATYAERSSLPGLVATSVPLFVTDAELDPDMFQEETDKLVAARAAAGKPVEHVHLAGHSHISETYAVGTGDRALSLPVLQFVRRVGGQHAH